jgi:hypothetical protein
MIAMRLSYQKQKKVTMLTANNHDGLVLIPHPKRMSENNTKVVATREMLMLLGILFGCDE